MSVEEMEMFNASISVTDLLMKTLENCAKNLAMRCISEAASRHGFDASEEIRVLGLENLTLIRKQMAKKSVGKGDKKPRERVAKEKKYVFPMPFVPEEIDIDGCQGLAYNRGLFTQCSKKRMENSGGGGARCFELKFWAANNFCERWAQELGFGREKGGGHLSSP